MNKEIIDETIDNVTFSYTEYTEDYFDKERVVEYVKEYKYTPVVITIEDVFINMEDDFNGEVEVKLSNGDLVRYECIEKRGNMGPSYTQSFYINDVKVADEEYYQEWGR